MRTQSVADLNVLPIFMFSSPPQAWKRIEAIHAALREVVALKRFKDLKKKNAGNLRFAAQIGALNGLTPERLRDLHFSVLIALTARSSGARLITSNRADFDVIHQIRKFRLEVW